MWVVLAALPIPWRERWGYLANELYDRGLRFPEDDLRAFDQVEAERRASDGAGPPERQREPPASVRERQASLL